VAPIALFHAGRALEALGEREEAKAALEAFLETKSGYTFEDDALLSLASLAGKQDPMATKAYAERVLVDHPDFQRREKALFFLALATALCGQTEDALEMLHRAMKDVPDESVLDEMVKMFKEIPVQECNP
jgi:tetratricopeptide (TPR) repeat protein